MQGKEDKRGIRHHYRGVLLLLLLCAVVAHSMALAAFQSVAVHTIATSGGLAGNQFSFSCSKVSGGGEDKEREGRRGDREEGRRVGGKKRT